MSLIVNGRSTSWNNLKCAVDGNGAFAAGFTEITFGDSIEETIGYGMSLSGKPGRRSHGRYSVDEGTLKGFRPDCMALLQQLSAKSGASRSYSAAEFVLTVQFAFTDAEPVSTVVLDRCRILAVNESHTEGAELSVMELKFRPMSIQRDGMAGFDRLPQL